MGKTKKKSLPTEAELFVCLKKDIQQLNKAVQDFVIQVNSNHEDVFDNFSDGQEIFSEQKIDPSHGLFDEDNIKGDECYFVDQIGDPIFDVYGEYNAIYADPIFEDDSKKYFCIGQFGDDVFDAEKNPVFDVVDEDEAEAIPIYDVFDENETKKVTDKEREDDSKNFNDSVYAQETPTFSNTGLVKSNGVTCDFNLQDKSPPFQTMIATVGRSDNFFSKSSRSNKQQDHMDGPKQELVRVCEERAGKTCMDLQKKKMNYCAWRKNFHRHINREPPDRVQQKGPEAEQRLTKFLNAKISKLEEALLLKQEKNRALERELSETRRNIRMLNKGTTILDKILSMGRTEKTTAGLGYQGGPSSSHGVFVRGNPLEPNKTDAVVESVTNSSKELPTVANMYTRRVELSLSQHQGCVRQIRSTGIIYVRESTSQYGEAFVRILQQHITSSRTRKGVFTIHLNLSSRVDAFFRQSIGQFSNLHLVCRRLFEQEDEKNCINICMLNRGSATLDKILSMGRIGKTTGLGYQGYSTSSQTVFVRDQRWKYNDNFAQECFTFEIPNEPRVRDNGTFPAVCVCLPHIEQKYCWFSTDCGHMSNLVFRNSCQQYKDMCSLFFPHKIIMWERDLMLSTVTLLQVSQSTSLRNLSSTHRICSIACVGQKVSDILENTSNECKFCNDRRLTFHGIIFPVGVLVEWFEVEYEAVREFLCVVTFGMEKSGILCTPLALKPFMLLPYKFTTVPSEFVLATGLQLGTYQERLRVFSIITLGSSDDMTNISIAEVSQFVQPMWLTRISSFSPSFLRPLRYCVLQPFLYNLGLLVVLARQEPEFYDIHIGSLCVKPRLIYVVNWCCVTVLEAHELLWVIFRNELLCFLKSREKGLRSVVFGEILAHVCIHDYHLACVISVGTVGVFLMRVPHVVGMTFTFFNKQETRFASRIFMSRQVSLSLGSSYTPTPLIWWSYITCTSSKPLCFFLDKDVLSFFRYTSFHSRPGVFVVVHLFSHNRLNGEKLRMSIQRLAKFYNFTWMCRDLFTYNRVRYAKHGETKAKSENIESSEERAAKLTRMLLLEIWEQSFPFRFEVESFKPGGT